MSERKIDEYVELTEERLFWRYFISRALRMSLILLRITIPDRKVGLILPLQRKNTSISHPRGLPELGESLVAWLGKNSFSATFPVSFPAFAEPNDFRVFPLKAEIEAIPQDATWIFVERQAPHIAPPPLVVQTIRRLFVPIYESAQEWPSSLSPEICGVLDPTTDFYSGAAYPDVILDGLANMVIRLGGQLDNGQSRWDFCCILLPDVRSKDPVLPLQKHNLVVRAQSKDGPYIVGEKVFLADGPLISLALRAFQSGRISYRPIIATEDTTVPQDEVKASLGSLIAIPVGGRDGLTLGVIYIGSNHPGAFTEEDQRVLGMMGKITEELLVTYRIRPRITENPMQIIDSPGIIDSSFKDFPSETDFLKDVEKLVREVKAVVQTKTSSSFYSLIQSRTQHLSQEVVSFIAIDMDNQSSLASKYGDQMARNLSLELGSRIQGQLRLLFAGYDTCRLYHVHSDRFYILLKGVPLERAQERAELLRDALGKPYQIDAQRVSIQQPRLPGVKLSLQDLTVRLVVISYAYGNLNEMLQRYSETRAGAEVSGILIHLLDSGLKYAYEEGGNVMVFWNDQMKEFVRWSPQKLSDGDHI